MIDQMLLLSLTFLLLAIVLDGTWAITAAKVRTLLAKNGRLRNRASGGMLAGAALGLAMARKR